MTALTDHPTTHEHWLMQHVARLLDAYNAGPSMRTRDEMFIVVGALKVLGFEDSYVFARERLRRLVTAHEQDGTDPMSQEE